MVDRLSAEPAELETGEEDAHRQRKDEGIEIALDDRDAVEGPHGETDQQHHQQPDPWAPFRAQALAGFGRDQPGAQQRSQAKRALQRDVELAGEQDQRLGHHDHPERRTALRDVDQVG